MKSDRLTIRRGNFLSLIGLFDSRTVLDSSELIKELINDEHLREHDYWTSNLSAYVLENNEAFLYFAKGDLARRANPMFKNPQGIYNMEGYVNCEDIQELFGTTESDDLIKINLSDPDFRLKKFGFGDLGYLRVYPQKRFDKLTNLEKSLVEVVYGKGTDLENVITFFDKNRRVKDVGITIFTSSYVKKRSKGKAIVSPCLLNGIDGEFGVRADNNMTPFMHTGYMIGAIKEGVDESSLNYVVERILHEVRFSDGAYQF